MTNRIDSPALPVLEDWSRFVGWLLDCTEKFPKKARFTFVGRIQNLALDNVERLMEARYAPKSHKSALLDRINLNLEQLRILLRLSHERHYLSPQAYEHSAREIENVGRQVGGWKKGLGKP